MHQCRKYFHVKNLNAIFIKKSFGVGDHDQLLK
jgi:hypothetical protein